MKNYPGLSFASADEFAALPRRLPPDFWCLEFPGAVLDSPELSAKASAYAADGVELLVRDLTDPGLADAAAAESWPVKLEFDRRLRLRCEVARKLGVRFVGLDMDYAAAAAETGNTRGRMALLRGLFGLLEGGRFTLLLPFKAPGAVDDAAALMGLKRKLLFPGLAVAVDFFVREPGALEFAPDELKPLRYESVVWRLEYDFVPGAPLEAETVRRVLQLAGNPPPEGRRILFALRGAELTADFLNGLNGFAAVIAGNS